MIEKERALVVDVDGTLCAVKRPGGSYRDVVPEPRMIAELRHRHAAGWRIILCSSRGMRSHDGNLGEINRAVMPEMLAWLARHEVPFDELHLGKPWPGRDGFYVDDRAVRPREFLENGFEALERLVERDRITGDPEADGGAASETGRAS